MMKNVKAILAAAVVATGLGLSAQASSILSLFPSLTSSDLEGASIEFKYSNYDYGKLYTDPTKLAADQWYNSEYKDIGDYTASDGLKINGNPVTFEKSDSWGLFKVYSVVLVTRSYVEYNWSPSAASELTGIFWGEQDSSMQTLLNADPAGNTQVTIQGTPTKLAFFYDTNPDYSPISANPNSYTPANLVSTINKAIDGELVLSALSETFSTTYYIDPGTKIITTSTNSTGGKLVGDFVQVNADATNLLGSWNSSLDSNTFQSDNDWELLFTTKPGLAINGEPVTTSTSNDPLSAVAIPTPTAVWGGVMLAGMIGMNIIRRRRAE